MYPSGINPNETFFTMSFNQNPNPTQIDPPLFPEFSSFLDGHDDDHLFFDQLADQGNANMELPLTNTTITNTNDGISSIANTSTAVEGLVPEKRSKRKTSQQRRTGKKDRHSKIYTAQGLRDRRMRLSLQIARKFFDLQDMLGFDKASKTIEWLFSKSKKAIREVTLKHPHMKNNFRNKVTKESVTSESEMIDEKGKTQNFVFDPVTREMRNKARARARERTQEKMLIKSKLWKEPNFDPFRFSNPKNYMDELGYYSSPFEAGDESSSRSQEKNSPYEAISSHSISTQTQLVNNVEMMEKYFGGSGNSSMMFDYQNIQGFDTNYFLGFLGSSELDSTARINSNNYWGLITNMAADPLTGNFHEQNPSSLFAANYADIRSQEEYKE